MAKCPSCGTEAAEGANFCAKCGASLVSLAVSDMIRDAQRALAADPDDVSARYNLAIAYKLGGMQDLALEELSRVAQIQPDFGDAHYEIGALLARLGRREEAVEALKRARELSPEDGRAGRLLARLEGKG
jgi:tetratricopeptide (TPR) repeat protein